jgi:hypothetical protein
VLASLRGCVEGIRQGRVSSECVACTCRSHTSIGQHGDSSQLVSTFPQLIRSAFTTISVPIPQYNCHFSCASHSMESWNLGELADPDGCMVPSS